MKLYIGPVGGDYIVPPPSLQLAHHLSTTMSLIKFLVVLATCLLANVGSATLTVYNSPIGYEYVCNKTNSVTMVEAVVGVDVNGPALVNCIANYKEGKVERMCRRFRPKRFTTNMNRAIKNCCKPTNVFHGDDGNRCIRRSTETEPVEAPASGCNSAVRKTGLGISASCGCDGGFVVDVDFFVARLVNDECLMRCVSDKLSAVCIPAFFKRGTKRGELLQAFKGCCRDGTCSDTGVGTKFQDKGYTCGLDLKFGAKNPLL